MRIMDVDIRFDHYVYLNLYKWRKITNCKQIFLSKHLD